MNKKEKFSVHGGEDSDKASMLRVLVFGIEDGIVSTTGAVIGIAAGAHDRKVVILSGIVIVIVEALSMAAGTFLSSKSQKQLIDRQISEEKEEIEKHPEKREK